MIPHELKSQIESFYDIGIILEISKLEGGYWNQTLKIKTEKGDFVARISRPRAQAKSIFYQHNLMKFMHDRIPEVPLPVAGKNGETFFVYESKIVSLASFLQGEMASRKNTKHQTSAAKVLAKMHRAALGFPDKSTRFGYAPLADFDWENNNNWHWKEVENLLDGGAEKLEETLRPPIGGKAFDSIREIAARKTQIAEELKAVRIWIQKLKNSNRPLVFAPTHGDYYPSNLLAVDDKISAVLDWDECKREWLAYELGRAMWEFCRYDETPVMNKQNTEAFLKSYQEAGGVVSEKEYDLLAGFIRCVSVNEVLFSLGEALSGNWWEPEYTLYDLEALDKIDDGKLFA